MEEEAELGCRLKKDVSQPRRKPGAACASEWSMAPGPLHQRAWGAGCPKCATLIEEDKSCRQICLQAKGRKCSWKLGDQYLCAEEGTERPHQSILYPRPQFSEKCPTSHKGHSSKTSSHNPHIKGTSPSGNLHSVILRDFLSPCTLIQQAFSLCEEKEKYKSTF